MIRPPLVRTALAVLLAASPALAQGKPPVVGGGRSGGEPPRVRSADEPQAGAPEGDAPAAPATPEQEVARLVGALGAWPGTDARQASIRLTATPGAALPALLAVLSDPNADWRSVCGAAATLGRIGDLRAADAIAARLNDRALFQHSSDLLDALVKIDPLGAKPRLLAQLLHPASAVVVEARERLAGRVGPGDADALREIWQTGGAAARLNALELLAAADPVSARADLAAALRDDAPEITFAAARLLADDDDPAALEALRGAAHAPLDRPMAYGYLGLALRAERTGELLLDALDVRALLGGRGLDHVERLNRCVAALALADAGYFHEVDALEQQLDAKVLPALLECWINPEFWKDGRVVQPLVLRRLRRLTGRSELHEPREWRAWWEENRRGFTARRVLASVPADALPTFVVRVAGRDAPGGETTVLAASTAELGPALAGELSILLPEEDARALAELVNASGVLRGAERASSALLDRDALRLSIRAGNRERLIGLEGSREATGSAEVLARVAELRAAYGWQRYRPLDASADVASFVRSTGPLFSKDVPEEVRRGTLAQLIVDAVGDARGDAWNCAALRDLASIPDFGAQLGDTQVDRLLRMLGTHQSGDELALALVRVLAASRRPEALPIVVDFVTTRVQTGREALLDELLAAAPDEGIRAALADARPEVRVAGLAALRAGSLDGKAALAARGAVHDEERHVRGAAVRALGRLGDEESRAMLEQLAKEPGELRIPAIEALGLLGGKASLAVVMLAFTSDDVALRVAAIEAFAAGGEPEGLSAVVFAMGGDPNSLVREVASMAITRVGSRRAADELRKLAIDPAQPAGPRARALSGYSVLRGREAVDDLRRLVADPAVEVGDEAAMSLALWRDPAGVARLVEMLAAGRNTLRARRALESLSLQSFGQDDPTIVASLYDGWWEIEQERGPRGWLADALRLEGVDDPALDPWVTGRGGREVVPSLLQGVRSERWYLRRACDLALRDALGRTVGEQTPWTTSGEAARMATEWERIWAEILGQ